MDLLVAKNELCKNPVLPVKKETSKQEEEDLFVSFEIHPTTTTKLNYLVSRSYIENTFATQTTQIMK